MPPGRPPLARCCETAYRDHLTGATLICFARHFYRLDAVHQGQIAAEEARACGIYNPGRALTFTFMVPSAEAVMRSMLASKAMSVRVRLDTLVSMRMPLSLFW
jgi:hypothetical protein